MVGLFPALFYDFFLQNTMKIIVKRLMEADRSVWAGISLRMKADCFALCRKMLCDHYKIHFAGLAKRCWKDQIEEIAARFL